MQIGAIEHRRGLAARAAAATLLALGALASRPAAADPVPQLIEVIDASETARNVDVLVQFACGARYVGHTPPEGGKAVAVRLRLGADCGLPPGGRWPSERPAVTGNSQVVRAAWLDETMPGEVAVTLVFDKPLTYVLAPVADGRGVRLRLLEVVPRARARVSVSEPAEPIAGFAINLESSRTPFAPEEVAASSTTLGVPTYVSSIDLQGTTWYRLRAGPIAVRRDAEKMLAIAQQRYPHAWLAINDEAQPAPADAAVVPPAAGPATPTDPPLTDAERKSTLDGARAALSARDYPRAVELLTKLTRQPEYPDRARAQEMLGLARERAGQLAHAKAEYAEYLRRYPEGDAAPRVRARLRSLAAASRIGQGGTRDGGADGERQWRFAGTASQMYRWERMSLQAPETSIDRDSLNSLLTYVDLQARYHGERYEMLGRVATSYSKDLLQNGPGDDAWVSSAFLEINDRQLGVAGRLGRQSRNSGGLLGTFDGLYASWQANPWLSMSTAVGFPVESTRNPPMTDRRFLGIAAGFGPFDDAWDVGAYAVAQQYSGEVDRRAIGVEGRYFVPGRTFVGMVDYDVAYHALNSAVFMGSLQLPARWVFGFNLDHRHSPVLTTRNALIGQPVQSFEELQGMYSSEELRQLADDRTPLSDVYSLSLSRPLGDRVQFAFDAYSSRTAATPASGGVPATPEGPLERTLQVQVMANNLVWTNDLLVVSARYQHSDVQTVESLGLWTRLPMGSVWRIGPRLRVDRRETRADLGTELTYSPGLRLDYQRGWSWIEFECAAELGHRDIPTESERSRRYYVGLGYRIAF